MLAGLARDEVQGDQRRVGGLKERDARVAGPATGSSRYQMISGIAAANSSGETTLTMCSTPIAAADSAATSISE